MVVLQVILILLFVIKIDVSGFKSHFEVLDLNLMSQNDSTEGDPNPFICH